MQSLPTEVQEQLFGILRAALDATLVPLLEKQRLLEERLEWLNQAEQRAVVAAAARPATVPPPAAPSFDPPSFDLTPTAPLVAPRASVAPRAELVSTSYGSVIVPSVAPPRPAIEVELANVGPIDMPDFGRNRRAAGRVLIALLLAGVAAAITATILSYT